MLGVTAVENPGDFNELQFIPPERSTNLPKLTAPNVLQHLAGLYPAARSIKTTGRSSTGIS